MKQTGDTYRVLRWENGSWEVVATLDEVANPKLITADAIGLSQDTGNLDWITGNGSTYAYKLEKQVDDETWEPCGGFPPVVIGDPPVETGSVLRARLYELFTSPLQPISPSAS